MIYPVNALSDADLERRVRNYLATHGVRASDGLQVGVNQGVVTLRGQLSSESAHWLAVSCGRRVAGVVTLIDQLHVIPRAKIANRQVAANRPSWMLDYLRNDSLPRETGYEYDPDHEPSVARRRL
jgi:murein L,D-transpeptidase YcbB/YkuD